jgi:hypothetical protein
MFPILVADIILDDEVSIQESPSVVLRIAGK